MTLEAAVKAPARLHPIPANNVHASRRHYLIICPECGCCGEDDGILLECRGPHNPCLLRTEYSCKTISYSTSDEGLYRYRAWLPISHCLRGAGSSATFQSKALIKRTGIQNLWISFNGYWPEKGATLPTATFKDLEAYSVLGRTSDVSRVLVVASAGNTAASFVRACSVNDIPLAVIVPESGLTHLRLDVSLNPCVKVVCLSDGSDYSDAIDIANRLGTIEGFVLEGGANNVARRDGLGTVLLGAFETIGRLPDYYFQSVGSGTGAIAVHECARRLKGDPSIVPQLWVTQNYPFTPIYDAWKLKSRMLRALDADLAKSQIAQIEAKVLSNRCPPYSVKGGLFDVLTESTGDVMSVTNAQILSAFRWFKQEEGVDLDLAAAAALANLLDSSDGGKLPRDSTIVLNVTGGGRQRLIADRHAERVTPSLVLSTAELHDPDLAVRCITKLFA